MIVHDIEQHGKAAFMTSIYEFLQGLCRSVVLVRSQVEIRFVTPVFVSAELGNRHQLDRVDAKLLEVVEGIDQSCPVVIFDEVSDNHIPFKYR